MKLYTTTATAPWREIALHAPAASTPAAAPSPQSAAPANPLRLAGPAAQTVTGFGGCFNEIGGRELLRLPEPARAEVLEALFGPTGCAFDFCRLPIGASDYAVSWYSHADTPDDLALAHFSIERDRRFLLPYIHAAQAVRPDLRFFASPWSPPAWMKFPERYNGGRLRAEPAVRAAYADYFLRYVRAYRAEGVSVSQIHVQNEPNSDQKFPSCLWTGAEMRDFIRDHLGPRFESAGEACEIWAGTIERAALIGWDPSTLTGDSYHTWAHTILSDPAARRFIKGVGYQWNGKGSVAQTRAEWPDLPVIQTENECGDGKNSWDYAFYVFDLLWHYFNDGCSAYVYWNMILPPGGQSTWGWNQNTMIMVDGASGAITYNPEFYVMKHLAHHVRPGARFVPVKGNQAAFSLHFENADGTRALLLANPSATARALDFAIPGLPARLELEPRSLATVAF
jgi:glucosylceramidase